MMSEEKNDNMPIIGASPAPDASPRPKQSVGTPMETTMRRMKKRKVRVWRVVLLAFLVMCGTVFAIINTDPFKIRTVEVSGIRRVSAEQIYRDSNIEIGGNLVWLRTSKIKRRIEQRPLVTRAVIHRILPSTVSIIIFERKPYAYVTNGKDYYLIDREGYVLDRVAGIGNKQLFRVYSNSVKPAQRGEKLVFPHSPVFDDFVIILDKYMAGRYQTVRFDRHGIKLTLRDGTYVLLGKGSDLEKKIMLVPVITEKLNAAHEEYEGLNLEYLSVPSFIEKEKTGAQ